MTDKRGEKQTIEANTVVLAAGAKSNIELLKSAREIVPEVHVVGDCIEPRRIQDAIRDGYQVGLAV